MMIATALVDLLVAMLFVPGLQFLSSPPRARYGNWLAAAGMALAVGWTVVVLFPSFTPTGIAICVAGIVIGGVAGTVAARRVKMTAMPQMVALFNGVGGGAAALVAVSELLKAAGSHPELQTALPDVFAIVIGGISFAGSMIAFAKLQELITGTPITFPGQHLVNGLPALVTLAVAGILLSMTGSVAVLVILLILVLGVAFVLPIGGADMPIVISLLNACTALAVAASGFVFGAFGQVQQVGADEGAGAKGRAARAGTADDIGLLLAYSHFVIIVPGYGLAVAQAQHVLRELIDLLEQRG